MSERAHRAADSSTQPAPQPGRLLRLVADQRVAFLIVGGINTLVGYGFFVLFHLTVGRSLQPQFGAGAAADATLLCAHIFSVFVAFVLYRRFVFRVRGHVLRDLARFESVYLVAIGVNLVVLPVLVSGVRFDPLAAQALILIVTTLISFFGHRGFSFRRSAAAEPAEAD